LTYGLHVFTNPDSIPKDATEECNPAAEASDGSSPKITREIEAPAQIEAADL
jgi:hypothetical protein